MNDKIVKLYYDQGKWNPDIKIDDFIVAIGKTKSNSVYHVAEVNTKQSPKNKRLKRHHLKCYKTDLITALNRDPEQYLFTMVWYSRNKKKK